MAIATDATCEEDDGRTVCEDSAKLHCARQLLLGERAPYDGQLLTIPLAINLGLKAEKADERVRIEKEYAEKACAVKVNYAEKLHTIDAETWQAQRAVLEKALKDASPAWYEEPWFVATATALTLGVSAWGLGSILKASEPQTVVVAR